MSCVVLQSHCLHQRLLIPQAMGRIHAKWARAMEDLELANRSLAAASEDRDKARRDLQDAAMANEKMYDSITARRTILVSRIFGPKKCLYLLYIRLTSQAVQKTRGAK